MWKELNDQAHERAMQYAAKCGKLNAALTILKVYMEVEADFTDNQEIKDFLNKQIKFIEEQQSEVEEVDKQIA